VPLVYRVSFLGKLSVLPLPVDPDADDVEPDDAELLDEPPLLHAVATPSVSTATAAVP
jgi:hypothetical protein